MLKLLLHPYWFDRIKQGQAWPAVYRAATYIFDKKISGFKPGDKIIVTRGSGGSAWRIKGTITKITLINHRVFKKLDQEVYEWLRMQRAPRKGYWYIAFNIEH